LYRELVFILYLNIRYICFVNIYYNRESVEFFYAATTAEANAH